MVSELGMASSSNQNTQNASQPSQIIFSFITRMNLDRSNYMIWKSQALSSIEIIGLSDTSIQIHQHQNDLFLVMKLIDLLSKLTTLHI